MKNFTVLFSFKMLLVSAFLHFGNSALQAQNLCDQVVTANDCVASTDTPLAIVDLSTQMSEITLSGLGTVISDVNIITNITHTFSADLEITLTSPQGTITTITTDNGFNTDNVFNGTQWDDSADVSVTNASYTNNVTATSLIPEGAFGVFIGEDPNGTWTLNVFDDSDLDEGSIDSWELCVSTIPVLPSLAPAASFSSAPAADFDENNPIIDVISVSGIENIFDVNLITDIEHTSSSDIEMTLTSPAGTTIDISSDNGSGNDNIFAGTLWDDNTGSPVTDFLHANLVTSTPLIPEDALAAFIGEDPNGDWTLSIIDDFNGSAGILNSWSLDIVSCEDIEAPTSTCADPIESTGEFCPMDIAPDVVDGTWIEIPANGVVDIELGTMHSLDLNCLIDNASAIGDIEIRLASSVLLDATESCPTLVESVYDVRDEAENIALGLLTVHFCMSTIDVDNTPPTATCTNLFRSLDDAGMLTITPEDVDFNSISDCVDATLSIDVSTFTCDDIGENTVILTVTEANGNTSTCASLLTVSVQSFEIAICQDITVQLDDNGMVSITPEDIDNGSFLTCGEVDLSLDVTDFTVDDIGENTVFLTVTDISDTSSSGEMCSATVTVEDVTAPIAMCQDITVQLDDTGIAEILATDIDNGSSDLSGPVTLMTNVIGLGCSDIGENTVILTVTDGSGNTATCTSTVTVEDNPIPSAFCQDITIQLENTGMVTIAAADVDGGSLVSCGDLALAIDIADFTCADVGDNTVTLTVTSDEGNTVQCTSTVTVEDAPNPTAICQDITIQLDDAEMVSIVAADIDNGSIDACGGVTLALDIIDFTCDNLGTNTVTLTVTDEDSNTATCTATVTVQGATPPILVCQDITVQLDGVGMASITATDVDNGSADACGGDVSLSLSTEFFTCDNLGENMVTLIGEDAGGVRDSCMAVVTVQDTIAPMVSCVDTVVYLDENGMVSVTGEMLAGIVTVSTTGGNNAGNSEDGDAGSTFYTVNILTHITLDIEWTFSTMDDFVFFDPFGYHLNGDFVVLFEPNGPQNQSGSFSITLNPGDIFGPQVNTLDNAFGAATGSFMGIPLTDDFIEPNWSLTNINADGTASFSNSLDNCLISTFEVDIMDFTCADIGDNDVTVTITDLSGNATTCQSVVTVLDTLAPSVVCQDITVALDDVGQVSITSSDVDGGSTDNCTALADLVFAFSKEDFTCDDIGDNLITLTITDESDNVDSCMATVTVVNPTGPIAICRDITVQLDDSGMESITAAQLDNGSNDRCGAVTLSIDITDFTCDDIGDNAVVLTVTDVSGNTSTCTSTVTVDDNVDPTAICQDITIQLDDTGMASIEATDVDNGSFDACGPVSLSIDITDFTCADVGDNFVTLQVTDSNGNSSSGSTCLAKVTVESTIEAIAICQDITVQLDDAGMVTIAVVDVDNGSSSLCGAVTLALDNTDFSCADLGVNTVTLTVTDASGSTASCMSAVTVEDTTSPTAICQDITIQMDDTGMVSITADQIDNGSSDLCSAVTVALDNTNFSAADVGANTVVLTVTDASGNMATCTATVIVEDMIMPTAICQDITVQLDDSGMVIIEAADIDNGSSDLSGDVTLAINNSEFTCSNLIAVDSTANNSVTLTVTDASGNTATCTSLVTVEDVTPPTAICQDITVQLDDLGMVSIVAADLDNGSSDVCTGVVLEIDILDFTCADIGTNTVMLTVTDASGNAATCASIVTVEDVTPPEVNCQNFMIQLEDTGMVTIDATDIDNGSFDLCGDVTLALDVTDFTCADIGENAVILIVTDSSGNLETCTAVVTIEDMVPTVLCQDITVQLDDAGMVSIEASDIDNSSFDACSLVTLSIDNADFTCADIGSNTVTLTVTDEGGNSSTCTSNVTVQDMVPPTALCQDVIVQLDDAGTASIEATDIDNGSSDICGAVTLAIDISDLTCANLGANTVTLTVTDESGNTAQCTSTVTVDDVLPPTAICQDITVQLDELGMASVVASEIDNGSSDVCDVITLSMDSTDFTCADVGANTVALTVTDGSSNTAMCSATVTIEDTVPPTVLCQNITVQLDENGMASIVQSDIDNGSSDACGITSLILDITDFNCDNIGANTVTLTATDVNGNAASCEAEVTVEDNIAPIAICQDVTIELNENGIASLSTDDVNVFLVNNGSNDNCTELEDLVIALTQSEFTCADMDGTMSVDIPVTMTVTDEIGNSATCVTTVTLQDNLAPIITCPANINIALDPGDCDRIVDYIVLAEDNCGLVLDADGNEITQTAGLPSGSVFERGTTINTFEVTDPSGNISTCSFDVVVIEFQDPISSLVCNGNLNISLDQNCEAFIGADQILEGGPYGCFDDYIVEISGITGQTIFATGNYSVRITDPDTGNSCWSEVTVEDKLEPTLLCTECPPGATQSIELPFTGTLDADSPIWTRPFGQVGACAPSGTGVDIPYQTHEFLVLTGADSDFENVSFTAPSADFFMALYQDNFDPLNPCGNMIINNDDGGAGLLSQFDLMLESGTQYILVATTFNNNGNDFGDYVIELNTDAQLIDAPLECLFTCFDETAILAGVMTVPSPIATDNCTSNLPTVFTDVVTEGAICGSKVITRTFSIIGDNGAVLTSCVAEYQLFAAQFDQFITPSVAISLPCGSGTSPAEIEAFFDDPMTNDIMNPNCLLDVIENNEGTTFGYITYPILGCDGNTHLQSVDNNQCGFFTTFSDQVIPTCGAACGSGNVKIIRTWTILDWCNDDIAPFTFIQVIESSDNEAPTIEVADDFGVSVNPWNCLGDFNLPAPTLLHDLCSSDITYTVSGPTGTTLLAPNTTSNPSDYWMVIGAPKGNAAFTYTAADCCGNTSNAVLTVNIYDTTPPTPVATEFIIVNLTTSGLLDENGNAIGIAKIFTNSVDDGSYDGCSGVKIEIARESDVCDVYGNDTFNADGHPGDGSPNPNASNYDPDNGEYVKFCCADINEVDPVTGVEFGLVPVRMRVFDDGNGTGFYGDFVDNNGDGDVLDPGEYDNYNETWVTVRVEGKAIASIVCPPDVTLACDMDYTDPTMIGTATTLSLCESESVSTSFTPQLNSCGIGFVIATYTVDGSSPVITCSQRITMENPYPVFDPNGIRFPRDLPTSPTGQIACDDDFTFDPPTWTAGACDFIGYTEEVDTFFFELDPETGVPSDACFKILRRFTVIDWCVFDATNGQEGMYAGSQTIKITDRDAPVLASCAPQMFDVDASCERSSTMLTNSATDSGDCASDWLKWQIFVDTWADGVVDYEYSSFLPTNDTNINNDTNGNGINDRYLAPTSSGEEVSITVTELIQSSMYNHIVTWKVTDGCGNVASCETTFMVIDKKAPTPYCVSLSTALMTDGSVELWAIDFDLGAFDNCTAQDDLRFTFSNTLPENDSSYDAARRSSAMTFTQVGVIPVEVYVWDEKGNADFCTVMLTINDNDGTGLRVSGITATELGAGVSNAQVTIEAPIAEYPLTHMTNDAGQFAFDSNPLNEDYMITVAKNDNHTNGVSTLDLVLIQRHILGFADLDSPYKVFAADINNDEKVSSIDVVELRKVILGIQEDFSANTSWRFVNVSQTFADIMQPWPIDEEREIKDLVSPMISENFVAVKVGDVNATASDNVSGGSTEVRSGATMLLEIQDQSVVAGEQVEIVLSSEDFRAVSGLQMTIEFDGLTFIDVIGKSISLSANNVGVISDNIVTLSWNTNTAVTSTDDLFSITAIANKNGRAAEMIKVTDRVIAPEAYTSTLLSTDDGFDINTIELRVRGSNGVEVDNVLMQNEPNPFQVSTSITFNLANAGKASLVIRDITGKMIRTISGEYTSGMNTVSLDKNDFNNVGVFYYTLESGTFSDTKKMIIIE